MPLIPKPHWPTVAKNALPFLILRILLSLFTPHVNDIVRIIRVASRDTFGWAKALGELPERWRDLWQDEGLRQQVEARIAPTPNTDVALRPVANVGGAQGPKPDGGEDEPVEAKPETTADVADESPSPLEGIMNVGGSASSASSSDADVADEDGTPGSEGSPPAANNVNDDDTQLALEQAAPAHAAPVQQEENELWMLAVFFCAVTFVASWGWAELGWHRSWSYLIDVF